MTEHDFVVNPEYIDRSNPSRLTERIYLAGCATAREHDKLRELGITAVVNLTPDDYGCVEAGFKVFRVPINDAEPMRVRYIGKFLAQMETWEKTGETVLIHCVGGVSRTATFAIAWLMHKKGCDKNSDLEATWRKCEEIVGAARPIIVPHYLLKRAVIEHFEAV